jgi:hypothetical protein
MVITGTASDVILDVHTGNTAGTVAAGDDPRLSNARTPLAHNASHGPTGPDPVILDTSQITTGVFPSARLGTGTASSSTFLNGAGAWAVPAGGGGGGGTAASTTFDPTGTDLTSTDVQHAVVEVDGKVASAGANAVTAMLAAGAVLGPSLLPIYTTSGRPSSGAAYPMYWDSTVSKAGFWDGAAWRDAMGTAI